MNTALSQWLKILAIGLGGACATSGGALSIAARPWAMEDVVLALLVGAGTFFTAIGTGMLQKPKDATTALEARAGEIAQSGARS